MKNIIWGLAGLAIGAGIGVLATKDHFEKKYRLKADKEMDEYKLYLEKKYDLLGKKTEDEESKSAEDVESVTDEEKETMEFFKDRENMEKNQIDYTEYLKNPATASYDNKPSLDEIGKKYGSESFDDHMAAREHPEDDEYESYYDEENDEIITNLKKKNPREDPYEISEDDYNDPESEKYYEKLEVRCFLDRIIADEDDEILDNFYEGMFSSCVKLWNSDDWEYKFVRDEKHGIDYLIENMHETYSAYIDGTIIDDEWHS